MPQTKFYSSKKENPGKAYKNINFLNYKSFHK